MSRKERASSLQQRSAELKLPCEGWKSASRAASRSFKRNARTEPTERVKIQHSDISVSCWCLVAVVVAVVLAVEKRKQVKVCRIMTHHVQPRPQQEFQVENGALKELLLKKQVRIKGRKKLRRKTALSISWHMFFM